MKVLTAALAALLLVAICSPSEAHIGYSAIAASSQNQGTEPIVCCFTYMQRRVPRSLIASAYMTNSACTQPAVILVTKKGRQICTNPQDSWVQNYLKHLQTLKN